MRTCRLNVEKGSGGLATRLKKAKGIVAVLTFVTAMLLAPSAAFADIRVSYSWGENDKNITAETFDYMRNVNTTINSSKVGSHIWIRLDGDVVDDDPLKLPAGKTVELDLNGYKIDRDLSGSLTNGYVIQVGKRTKLKINGGPHANRTTKYHMWYKTGRVEKSGTKIGGMITGGFSSNTSGGIHALEGSVVSLNDVTIAGCRAEQSWGSDGYGGGFYASGKDVTLNMNNSSIRGCYAYNDGGGLYANNKFFILSMTNSHIDENYAQRYGGGIALNARDTVTAKGNSTVSSNTSAKRGGGIYISGSEASVSSLNVTNNTVDEGNGGGVAIYNSEVGLSGLTIKGNKAVKGGGVFVNNKKATISSCTITGNSTSKNTSGDTGAGMFVNDSLTVSGITVVKDNGNGSGNLVIAGSKTSFEPVKFSLSKKSDVHVGFESLPTKTIAVSEVKTSDCVEGLTSDHSGYKFWFDKDKRLIYFMDGSQQTEPTVPVTTIAPSDAMTAKETGQTENGYPVLKGYLRYPSFERTSEDIVSPFYYSDGYFVDADPTVYNTHLATCSLNMAMSGFYLNAGGSEDYTNKHASARQFMASIGCQDQDIYINDFNAQKPGVASIGVTIAAKQFKDNEGWGTGKYLIPVAVRGSGYEAEWASNMTLGDATNAATGTEAQGFGDAANKVMQEIDYYLAKHGLNKPEDIKKLTFWVVGYSRAGATANLTSKRLVEKYGDSGAKVFGYTFEAPQGGTDLAQGKPDSAYHCIHNIVNYADLVTLVGPTAMGFKRYGVDHYVPGGDAGAVSTNSTDIIRGGKSGVRTVTTLSDNQRIETTYVSYSDARKKMLVQLPYVDPALSFDDYFATAVLEFIMPAIKEKPTKEAVNEERFIRDFIENLQAWSVPNRDAYAKDVQPSLSEVVGLVFGLSPAASEEFINRVSTLDGRLGYDDLILIYDEIRRYSGDRESLFFRYVKNVIYKGLVNTGALDFLSPSEQKIIEKNFTPILKLTLRSVNKDSSTKSYKTSTMLMFGTLGYNVGRIMTNHVPEVNLAWLRSYDSYYNGENCAYRLGAASSPNAPMAIAQKAGNLLIGMPERIDSYEPSQYGDTVELKADSWNNLSGATHIDLGVKGVQGEAIYYKLTKDGKSMVATPACANGYDVYRGGIDIDFSKDEGTEAPTYVITAYAVSFGQTSPEVSFAIKGHTDDHQVVVVNNPNDKEETFTLKEGTKRTLSAVVPRGNLFKTWKFTDQDGNDVSSKILLANGALTDRNITFLVPRSGDESFKPGYSLRIEAVYYDPITSLTITNNTLSDDGAVDFSKLTYEGHTDELTAKGQPKLMEFTYADVFGTHITTNEGYKDTNYLWYITLNEEDSNKLDRNVEVSMEGASDIQRTWNDDGTLTITGEYKSAEATKLRPANTVNVEILRCNAMTYEALPGMEDPIVTTVTIGQDGLISLMPPEISGGAVFAGWLVNDAAGLEPVEEGVIADDYSGIFRVTQEPQGTYSLHALYKPLCTAIRVGMTAPVVGEELATTATVEFVYDTNLFVFPGTYDEHVWEASVEWSPRGETTLAQENTNYQAFFRSDFNGWIYEPISEHYLPVEVTGDDAGKESYATFNPAGRIGRIEYNEGPAELNHTVMVYDSYSGGATQYAWQEGALMEVVAQEDDNYIFDHWKITTMRDGEEVDVTKDVISDIYDRESDNPTAGHTRLEIVMPNEEIEPGTGLPEGYELTVTAVYRSKCDKVSVLIPTPGTTQEDISNKYWSEFGYLFYPSDGALNTLAARFVMMTFSLPDGGGVYTDPTNPESISPRTGSLKWERETTDGVTVGTTEVYKNTTYHVHAYIEPRLARYLRKDNAQVEFVDGEDYTDTSWTWDDAGGLMIDATIVTDDETGYEAPDSPMTFEVSVDSSDINDPERKQLEGVEVEKYTFVQDGEDLLYVSPTRVAGATFAGWEIPAGSGLELVNQVAPDQDGEPDSEPESNAASSKKDAKKDVTESKNTDDDDDQDDEASMGIFRVIDSEKPLEAIALYMPLVKSVTVGLPAPVAGEDMPTIKDVTVTATLQNEAFSPVSMVATKLEWNNSADDDQQGDEEKADDAQKAKDDKKADDAQKAKDDKKADQSDEQKLDEEGQGDKAAYYEFYYADIELDKEDLGQEFAFADDMTVSYAASQGQDAADPADSTYMTYAYDNDEPPITAHLYFEMTEKAKLVFVQNPADVFDLDNGTDISSLLPPSTDIVTSDPTINTATIDWVETTLDYDGGDSETSIWLATGTINLPDNVENPDNVDLDVAMEFFVNPPEDTTVYAEMPYATLQSGEYSSWQSIELGTLEEGGTVYYKTDLESEEYKEYQGEFIDLNATTVDEEGLLIISAYTSVEGKANSPEICFVYGLTNNIPVPENVELTYNGEEQVGVWNDGGYTLTAVSDGVTIDEDGNACATVPGTYTVTAKLKDGYTWDMGYDEENDEPITSQEDQTITFTIAQEPVTFATIDAIPDQPLDADGATPDPVVRIGDTVLQKGVDYDVTYEDNKKAGKAKLTITGKGNFTDTLSAEFNIVSITITYDANGGTGTMEPQVVGPGIETPLANNAFTNGEYEFNGWNEEADGTGEAYHEGEPVAFNESVTLYAQWARKTYVVAAFSRALDAPTSVADIQIDPSEHPYEEGSQVTVTAPAKRGWAFVGWYPVTELENGLVKSYDEDTQLSTKRSYSFTVNARTSVVAVYEATADVNASVRIISVNAASYTVKLDGKGDSSVQQGSTHSVPIGTKLTITAKDPEKVVMWLNESNKVIGTGQTSLDYTVTSSTTISLVYSTGSNEQTQVKFISADDQVLLYRRYSADLTDASLIEMPTPPTKLGNTFVRWVFEGTKDEATQATILAKVKSPAQNYAEVFVRPEYKASEEKAKVTLLTQKVGEEAVENAVLEFQPGIAATVTAPTVQGLTFESWRNADGDVLGYVSPIKLCAIGSQTITACYVPEGTEVVREPVISITGFSKTEETGGLHRIQCLMTRNVPEGYSLVEHGVLFGTELGGLSEDTFVYGREGVNRFVYKGKDTNGAAYFFSTVSRDSTVVYFRAYMVLKKDGSNDQLTFYSDIEQASYNTIDA